MRFYQVSSRREKVNANAAWRGYAGDFAQSTGEVLDVLKDLCREDEIESVVLKRYAECFGAHCHVGAVDRRRRAGDAEKPSIPWGSKCQVIVDVEPVGIKPKIAEFVNETARPAAEIEDFSAGFEIIGDAEQPEDYRVCGAATL